MDDGCVRHLDSPERRDIWISHSCSISSVVANLIVSLWKKRDGRHVIIHAAMTHRRGLETLAMGMLPDMTIEYGT